MCGNGCQKEVFSFLRLCSGQFFRQVEIVTVDDTVFDQTVAGFSNFLVFPFGLGELSRVTDRDRTGKPIGQFPLVELFFQ